LKGFQQAGGVVILATHDLQELEDCDCLYTLKDGVLLPFAYDGDPEKLMERL
jgi:ABC-2 type transport system ATP-binding protein